MASKVIYEDFEPSTEIIQEKDCDTIVFNLPDFKKEQLRVQLTATNSLRITGNKQIAYNKYKRFVKELPISTNCNMQKISAKFEIGKLYIRLPKLIVEEDKLEPNLTTPTHKPPQDQETSQKPVSKPALTQDNATVVSDSGIAQEPSAINTRKDLGDHHGTEKKTSIDDDNDKEKAEEEKKEKKAEEHEDDGKTRIAKYKDTASNIAANLKKPRRVTNAYAVIVAILAVSVGLYISKLLSSCKVDVICT